MDNQTYIDDFIKECMNEYTETTPESTGDKLALEAIVSLFSILVYHGIKILLPEIKEWAKLGAAKIALKRQELEKKLLTYAEEKELDYEAAKKAAGIVTRRITEKNVEKIIKGLES